MQIQTLPAMTNRTVRDHARRDALRAQARELDSRLTAAVRADYPQLCGWALRMPAGIRMVRTGPREDDWRWGAYRSASQECSALRRYLATAVTVACRRISEAYGLGAGAEFAACHRFDAIDPDRVARAQVLASLAAI